ncbi:NAD(P)-dependent dehydrogenase (short-subunit alcohol dehydrogenase family) [Conexibacter arvalis]|uniref:NAD(P)-dependent dehydrogenase (Short-subunit alcohol dehydrogenase family) n=1 Tax=Conexibacter arvalis TaxID=912552 RepID=A0A840I8S8_9ACTN|nr:NAD(P)-dependent dehydrogenase (short-subunit alcohol dehydrogenase family) [Conexibacter arvalis]
MADREPGFAGRVAWVTGASRGLGRALVRAFADAGAEVVATARSADALHELAAEVRAAGGTIHLAPGSVASENDLADAIASIEAYTGRLDVLVNNAGVSPSFRHAETVPTDEWHEVLDVNLTGAFLAQARALELLAADGGGAVVNVSSVHGVSGHERLAAYSASKGGLEALTRTLAVEWAPRGVRVNAVAPGYLETDMTSGLRAHDRWSQALLDRIPIGRFGTVEEVVPAVLFLAGDSARYITGTTLSIDGGWTAR